MKTFAISDIHGHYDELMALMEKLPLNPKKDRMVFLGDFVDRGPKTKEVVQQLIDWKKKYPHWVVLKGNHEDMLIDALKETHPVYGDYYMWFEQGGFETKKSYMKELNAYEMSIASLQDEMPQEHLDFMASLPLFFQDDDYIYVHGGIKPGLQPWETEPFDLLWLRDEFIYSDYDWGKKVIFGHTTATIRKDDKIVGFKTIRMDNKIGIDTAICSPSGTGKLTAIELPIEKFYEQSRL